MLIAVAFVKMGRHMTEQEQQALIEHQALAFKARIQQRDTFKEPKRDGYSGPLGDVFLPAETVDQMETAIQDAFEQIEEGCKGE